MKKLYLTFFLSAFTILVNAQTTVSLINSPTNDLDALVSTKTNVNEDDMNFKSSPDVGCGTWTYGGAGTGKNRCFLNFDWSQIPNNATIISAELDLYSVATGWIILGGHNGANESWLKRVVDSWDPSTVTWNNQPGTSNTAAVTLNKSNSKTQDYLNIDVTQLVLDMKSSNSWHGFAFMTKNESVNGVLSFVSSNGTDSSKRPRLRLTYTVPTSIESAEMEAPKLLIYPNPSSNPVIEVSSFAPEVELELFNVSGQRIGTLIKVREDKKLKVTDFTGGKKLAEGIYFVRLRTSESEVTEKVVIQ